tara:strand:- start:23794 stop:24174 length:381 start_codon:yes stop_codon:yes gene_type:complete
MKFQVAVHIEATGTNGKIKYLAFDERYKLTGVKVVDNGGVTSNGSDYAVLSVFGNNGSTAAFKWSSQTGQEGALVDGVSASLADQKSGLDVYEAGTSIKISKTAAGSTGRDVDSMLILSFEPARKV